MTVLSDTPASPATTSSAVAVNIEAVTLSPAPVWPAPQWPVSARIGQDELTDVAGGVDTSSTRPPLMGPVHCGAPMPVRRLDPLAPHSRANQAVLEAAVAGQRVHACACGHLQCAPVDSAHPQPLCSTAEQPVFIPVLVQRVHAAAAVAESARWSFDQILAEAPPASDAAARWLFDADLESAAWALDTAELDLQETCAVARAYGVDPAALAQAAGTSTGTGEEGPETAGVGVLGATAGPAAGVAR